MHSRILVNKKKGFTLMESVIAIGVVALLLTTFLAVFGPATQGIRRAISAQEADRLATALQSELSVIRESQSKIWSTAFDKAYLVISTSSQEQGRILLFNYRGDPSSLNGDGGLKPLEQGAGAGEDYVLTPAVRFVVEGSIPSEIKAELEVASGPIFYVKTTQLIYDKDGALVLGGPGVVPPHEGQESLPGQSGADSYPEAVIAFSTEFFLLRSTSIDYLESFDVAKLGRPLFSRNMAVRR